MSRQFPEIKMDKKRSFEYQFHMDAATSRPVFPYIENLAVGLRVIFSLEIFDIQNQHTFFLPCPSDFSNFAHDSTSKIQVTDVAHVDR